MPEHSWRVRLSVKAERDFENILEWTMARFGSRQASVYRDLLVETIRDLGQGPYPVGSKARDEIWPGVRTLHVARHGRRGRHLFVYRVVGESTIEIGRILHDSMELARHLPTETGGGHDPESTGQR